MRRVASAGAVLAVALLAGCGGSDGNGTKTFEAAEVPVTFQYPASWETSTDPSIASQAGGNAALVRAVALDDHNVIVVETFDLNIAITKSNVNRAKPELDDVVAQLTDKPETGKRVKFAGLPGFEYTVEVTDPVDAQSRAVFLFDGKTEIELNCQSTSDKRSEVNEACDQALSTLRKA